MNGFVAILLAFLGVAMFSGSLWMQRDWLPQSRVQEELRAVSIDNEPEVEKTKPEEPVQGDAWATDHVLLK